MAKFDLSFLKTYVGIEDMRLFNPRGYPDKVMLDMPEIFVNFSLADLFKGKSFGLIYGIVEGGVGLAGAIGAWIGGYIFDGTQSYQGAFQLCIICILMSIIVIWLAAPRKVRIYGNGKTG